MYEVVLRFCAVLLAAVMLPNGWALSPPQGVEVQTGTMPQGMAPSPNGTLVAVVESGYNPAALSLYRLPDLTHVATIPLPGAFARPLWLNDTHVLVPGANADELLDVDIATKKLRTIAFPKGSYPAFLAVAPDRRTFAVASDGDGAVRIGTLGTIGRARAFFLGGRPGGIAFSTDGSRVFATNRSNSTVHAISVATSTATKLAVGLHPSAVGVSRGRIYIALADADAVAIYDEARLAPITTVSLRDSQAPFRVLGVSPNAITIAGDTAYVTLGAANSIAVIRNNRLIGRCPAGWYPTDVAVAGDRIYVLDGKGEGARPNPELKKQGDTGYIAAIEFGSLRAYTIADVRPGSPPQGSLGWDVSVTNPVVRLNGPIKHVFLVLKENRSYDEILGDMRGGNGDLALNWFGARVTPNEHAIAERFGLFDNAYASGEVSTAGHLWTDAAFVNDYSERFWPALYGGRRTIDDIYGEGASGASAGYIWDAARRTHVSFRDYGELTNPGNTSANPWTPAVSSLKGIIDPHYAGFNLDYSDLDRAKEWRREFETYVSNGTLPQFELIWLPNDHTYGSRAGKLTPTSLIAQNDAALGRIVDTLTHSAAWESSVMFVIEDDAQSGPDHVSDQRTTLFVVSPYAKGGVRHEHYATVSILRTIEMMLGIKPLSTYDAMAVPMYAAFTATPNLNAYDALPPKVSLRDRNARTAYGARLSAKLNFSKPDAVSDDVLNDILAHNHL
jgi:DNA-binding beta-propeller fold protein YncE